MTESALLAKRRRRRIPEEARKRNAQSCDRCRKRRCKCVPSQFGTSCVTCRDHKVACSYTSPRKTRFYGSLDDLSDRYQCLEAIVKGAFPDEDKDSVQDLQRLGERMGYEMPNLENRCQTPVHIEELIHIPYSQPSNRLAVERFHAGRRSDIAERSQTGGIKFSPQTPTNSPDPQASLVRDPSGNEHYIGPSGTWNFLNQLRQLVDLNDTSAQSPITGGATTLALNASTAQSLEADERNEEPRVEQPVEVGGLEAHNGSSPGSITSAIARDFTRFPLANMDEVLQQFPPNAVLEQLIHSYFKNVHEDFPLFHRATFEDEYELYIVQARRTPQVVRAKQRPLPGWGWIGCLHMMIVFGSIANRDIPDIDHTQLRRRSVAVARALLPQFISKCSLANVRVLILLSLFLHNNNERNAAWNLVGTATSISFALGLHRSDMSSTFRPLEREVRKRVLCTLYSFEQFLASSLGRPTGLQDIDVEIVPPREGFLDGGSGTDTKLVSWSLKLQEILARARPIHLVKSRFARRFQLATAPTAEEVLGSLDKWKQDIARVPGFDVPWIKSKEGVEVSAAFTVRDAMHVDQLKLSLSWMAREQLRSVLLLHIQFHYIAIITTRPFLLQDIAMLRRMAVEGRSGDYAISSQSESCVRHASQQAYLVILLDHFGIINGLLGLDIFYAYCAAMVLILRLLRKSRPSKGVSQAREDELQISLRDLLNKIQDVINRADKAASMKRFARVVDGFVDYINNPTPQRPIAGQTGYSINLSSSQGLSNEHQDENAPNLDEPSQISGNPDQMELTTQFPGSSMEDLLDLLPFPTLGGVGMDNGPWTQLLGTEDMPLPEWTDMEFLLAGYGGES